MLDYYALLGVPRFTASQDDIRKAYRTQIAFFHPDKGYVNENIALERTQQLNEAYDTLKNPSRKAVYDDSREGKSSRDDGHHVLQQPQFRLFPGEDHRFITDFSQKVGLRLSFMV